MAETVARASPTRAKVTPARRCLRATAGQGEWGRTPDPLAGPRPTPQSVPPPRAVLSSGCRALVAASQALDSARMPASSSGSGAAAASGAAGGASALGVLPRPTPGLLWETVKTRVVGVGARGTLGPSTAVGRTTGREPRSSLTTPPSVVASSCPLAAVAGPLAETWAADAGTEPSTSMSPSASPSAAPAPTTGAGESVEGADPDQPVSPSSTSVRSTAMAASMAAAVPEAMAWAAAERMSSSVITAAPPTSPPPAARSAGPEGAVGTGLFPEREPPSRPLTSGRGEALFALVAFLGMMPQLTGPRSLSGRRSRGVMRSPVPEWRRAPGPRVRNRRRRAGAGRRG